jgi:hypothetical protein
MLHNRVVLIFLAVLLLPLRLWAAAPQIEGCPTLPFDNIWNAPVDGLPISTGSDAYIASIGAQTTLHPDFGQPYWDGDELIPIGIPYNVVNSSQNKKTIHFDYYDESDAGPYPVPSNPLIEGVLPSGNPNADGDRHILIIEKDNCILYELYYAWPRSDGSWDAGSGAIFDLRSNALRPDGWTSADAAGLPILPGLVRYDEIQRGEITHALRFTARNSHIRNSYVWPARHQANTSPSTLLPPMGQRFRLKAGFDTSPFSNQMQIILKAMKKYGLILADNGSDWYISGTADNRWDNDTLVTEFKRLKGSDFEAVDVSSLMENPNSGKVKEFVPPAAPAHGLPWLNLLLKNQL